MPEPLCNTCGKPATNKYHPDFYASNSTALVLIIALSAAPNPPSRLCVDCSVEMFRRVLEKMEEKRCKDCGDIRWENGRLACVESCTNPAIHED